MPVFLEAPMFVLIFCEMFRKVLTKPQRRHLSLFLTQRAICSAKHQTVSHLRRLFLNAPSTKASCDFLKVPTSMWAALKERRKQVIKQRFTSRRGSLIIDDTLCYKCGKLIDGVYNLFCHVLGKAVLSHAVVTSVYKTPLVSIGYDFLTYVPKALTKDFKTKLDLAWELIEDAYQRGMIRRVFMDSWYCQKVLLKKIIRLNLEFFGMFKIDRRKIRTTEGEMMLKEFVQKIPEEKKTTRKIKARKRTYKIKFYREIVFIKGMGKLNLVVSWKYSQKKKTYKEPRVYITNVLSLRAMDVIRTYLSRWDIEVFHKTAKQAYGFEDYQTRRAQARDAYFELAFLSDLMLHLKQLGQLGLHRAGMTVPRTVPTEKIGSEDVVLEALAAQRKGTLDHFIEMCGFDKRRFVHFI